MKTFIYWDNSQKWKGQKIEEFKADNILAADKAFQEKFGSHPGKTPFVVVEIKK